MSINAETLRRLAALNLSPEAFNEVLSILAEFQGADDARRERERVRRAKYPRGRSQDGHRDKTVTVTGTVAGPSQGRSQDRPPSDSLKEASKIPEPNGSGPSHAELERELFRRGRQVCGKNSGGLINSLLKAKQHDVALARSVLETASTKSDPREFVAAAIRKNGHGQQSNLMDAFAELRAGAEGGDQPERAEPRDITPRSG